MRNHLVAIQGSVASFHDLAARKYFGEEVSTLECGSFREVCEKIKDNVTDFGVIAIENKIAGSILLNYHLIESFDLRVVGERYLPIQLNLYVKPGTQLSDIKEIISHPMALGQSQAFLSQLENVTVTEFKDTATCAKLVVESNDGQLAVIAGPVVGKKYNLSVIKHDVCDVKQNFTRFYIITKGDSFVSNPNKASIIIKTAHEFGKLSDVLVVLKKNELNLTKIQSVPDSNKPDLYSFHLDIEFKDKSKFENTVKELKLVASEIKVLGLYKEDEFLKKISDTINQNLN